MGWMDSLNDAARPRKDLNDGEREKIAKDLVRLSSFGAAAVTFAPLPLSDFFLVTPVQASMVMSVGRVYGRKVDLSEGRDILLELGAVCGVGLVAQKGFATLSKLLLPGLGGILAGPYAFAVTYGLGMVSIRYFASGGAPKEVLKSVFEEAVKEGKKIFSREKLDQFRKERGQEVTDFAQAQTASTPKTPKTPRTTAKRTAPKKRPAKKKPASRRSGGAR